MSGRKQGFTLLELMIVVAVLAVLVGMAIPSLIHGRKAGNEASAISALRTLVTVNQQYRTRFQQYADTLATLQLTGYVDATLGGGNKAGYNFVYARTGPLWACNANPATFGQEGDRGFYVDQTGVLRSAEGVPAIAADPPIDN